MEDSRIVDHRENKIKGPGLYDPGLLPHLLHFKLDTKRNVSKHNPRLFYWSGVFEPDYKATINSSTIMLCAWFVYNIISRA
jgi:hypothetical protein